MRSCPRHGRAVARLGFDATKTWPEVLSEVLIAALDLAVGGIERNHCDFMADIPTSLDEAAEIDGASRWQVFVEVILPLSRHGLIVLAIFTFLGNYASFFWPLVMVKSDHLRTLPVGMMWFENLGGAGYGRQTELMMAATVMNVVPLIVLFVVFQRYLVRGIQLGAVKG